MAKKIKKKSSARNYSHFSVAILAVVVIVSFYPTLKNDFVNWDDVIYVMNNDMIRALNINNISKIFSSFWMGNYHPLTLLSFSLDYSLFKLSAQGYHLHNLMLHLVNSVLVYFVTWHLLKKNSLAAFIVSVLFAIHPMHVESVAWVSERKDLLYTLYFLLAMLAYIFYVQTKHTKYLYYTLACFLLSLLAKAQAVTLPLVLLLIDYFLARKPEMKMFLEKIPFFLLSLVFGIVAIMAQKADESINPVGISVLNSVFYAQYSVWVYLYKLILPVNLTCLYNYPFTSDGQVPLYIYFSPLLSVALLITILKTWKKDPAICFGLLFFLVVIFPVLQFLPVGQAIVAERYTYIPYIGLFVIIAILFIRFRESSKSVSVRQALNFTGIGVLLVFSLVTWNRTKVWADSVALWTDVMEKNPTCLSAYVNRSYMYIQYKQYDKAIKDCDEGLKIDSNHYKLYINRGTAYRDMAVYDLALENFSAAIRKNPKSYDTYLDRGILYTDHFNKLDSGVSDFRYYQLFRPDEKNGNYNLGVAYYKKQNYDSALYFCKRTLEIAPDYAGAYFVSALVYAIKQDFAKAYEHGSRAQALGYGIDQAMLDGWRKNASIVMPDLR